MKMLLFFLILLNALFFGWSSWVAKTPLDLAVVTPEPDAPALVLFEEKFPERAQAERDAIEKIARDKRLAERAQREAEEAERVAKQQAADEEAARLAAEQAAADDAARIAKEQLEREESDRLAAVAAQEKAARDEAEREAAVAAQEQADRDEAKRVAALAVQEQADRDEAERLAAAAAKAQADRDEAARLAVVAAQEAATKEAARQTELAAAKAAAEASAAQTVPATVEVAAANTPPASRDQALDALNQLAAAPEGQPGGPQVVTADGPQEARCVRLGPFVQLRDAAKAAALLREFDVASTQSNEEAQVWVGHWVHLPPAESRAAAVEVVEKLRADGVSDIYIESAGERRHAISLGLFSDASRAEIRAGKIRKLGITPQIRDRFRDGSVYWLDFDLAPGQNVDPALFDVPAGKEIKLRPRDCPGTTQTG